MACCLSLPFVDTVPLCFSNWTWGSSFELGQFKSMVQLIFHKVQSELQQMSGAPVYLSPINWACRRKAGLFWNRVFFAYHWSVSTAQQPNENTDPDASNWKSGKEKQVSVGMVVLDARRDKSYKYPQCPGEPGVGQQLCPAYSDLDNLARSPDLVCGDIC